MRLLFVLFLLAAVAGAAVLFAFDPAGGGFYPPCLLHRCTGLHCPGCGTTRGLHALLHGRVWAAVRYNPLTVLALPFLALAFVNSAVRLYSRDGTPRPVRSLPPRMGWVVLWLVLAFAVCRNIPFEPFNWLAPTPLP
jgi:hypothetical protein